MILVDNALKARSQSGKPIRVGMVGAGFMGPVSYTHLTLPTILRV